MKINLLNEILEFQKVPLTVHIRDKENIFYSYSKKTLLETFQKNRYKKWAKSHGEHFQEHYITELGLFLKLLKEGSDERYLEFLNKNGDSKYCVFTINEHLSDKGLYCFSINGQIKYIGRCLDSFKVRINQNYGSISPKNCFKDGQSTNCHINSLINLHQNVEFGIFIMNDKSNKEISMLEKLILRSNPNVFEWNVQTK